MNETRAKYPPSNGRVATVVCERHEIASADGPHLKGIVVGKIAGFNCVECRDVRIIDVATPRIDLVTERNLEDNASAVEWVLADALNRSTRRGPNASRLAIRWVCDP